MFVRNKYLSHFSQQLLMAYALNIETLFVQVYQIVGLFFFFTIRHQRAVNDISSNKFLPNVSQQLTFGSIELQTWYKASYGQGIL